MRRIVKRILTFMDYNQSIMILLSIPSWWQTLGSIEQIYWGIALISTGLFLFQLALTFIGLDSDIEAEIGEVDGGFSLISVRSVIAFGTFFGWGGVVALSNGFTGTKVLMFGFLAGFVAMIAVAYIFFQLLRLQEDGTVELYQAIGKTAEIYLSVPEATKGKGKIHITLGDKLMEFDAISNGDAFPTGARVKVMDVLNENVMLVKAFK